MGNVIIRFWWRRLLGLNLMPSRTSVYVVLRNQVPFFTVYSTDTRGDLGLFRSPCVLFINGTCVLLLWVFFWLFQFSTHQVKLTISKRITRCLRFVVKVLFWQPKRDDLLHNHHNLNIEWLRGYSSGVRIISFLKTTRKIRVMSGDPLMAMSYCWFYAEWLSDWRAGWLVRSVEAVLKMACTRDNSK